MPTSISIASILIIISCKKNHFFSNTIGNIHKSAQYLSVQFMDLHPYGCFINLVHFFSWHTHCLRDCNQQISRAIKVSSSLRSLTLQDQAQTSPSLLYNPSGDPYFLANTFSHKNNFYTSLNLTIEASLWISLSEAFLQHMLPHHDIIWGSWLIIGFSCHYSSLFPCFPSLKSIIYPPWKDLSSHLYHIHTEICEMSSSIPIKFPSNLTPIGFKFHIFFFRSVPLRNQIHKYDISFS
jgi:hypothetical protein